MKKLPLLIFCLIILLCSCSVISKPPADKFKSDFTCKNNGMILKGKIYSYSNNMLTIKLSSPSSMNGYIYRYKNDKFTLSYKNLLITSDTSYLPENDFSRTVFKIIQSLKKENNLVKSDDYNSLTEYNGSCDSGEYKLICGNSGVIKEISLKENKFNIKFTSPKSIN